jgi:hypothetical protein
MLSMVDFSTSNFAGDRSERLQDLSDGGLLHETPTREPDGVARIAGVRRQLELL